MNWVFFTSLNWIFVSYKGSKNPVHQTRIFKIDNVKNQVQIDRGFGSHYMNYFIPTLAVKSVWNLHNPGYISEGAHQWLLHRKTILSKRELYLGIVKVCKPVPISYEKAKNHTTLVKLPIFQPPKPISPLNLVRHLENPQISHWYFDGKVKRILK